MQNAKCKMRNAGPGRTAVECFMSPWRWREVLGLVVWMALGSVALAQQNVPRIGYVFPAGGKQATAFEVTIGGQYLDGVHGVRVSGTGVEATVIEHVKPMTQQQFNALREKLSELQKKKATAEPARPGGAARPSTRPVWTAEDEKALAEVRKQLATFVRRPSSPAIAETVRLQVTLGAAAEAGRRELRLQTPAGLTNPLVFQVGQLPEFCEKEVKTSAAPYELNVTLPAVANGQIMPGDVDRYRFSAKKGQHLVAIASARELIPYLADAVPGWFQATLTLYDEKGKELAYADDYRFNPDPVLHYLIPRDGEYVLEIKDAIYRGREDFVYRIALGELPFVTGIFPLGGPAGEPTSVELKGWNLPASRTTMDAKDKRPGIYPLSVRAGKHTSNAVPFAAGALPESLQQEPNNVPASAQAVKLPVIINGRIDQPGDVEVFSFQGRAGEQIVAEVLARRLNSPVDSMLRLTDAAGKQVAFNDDHEDKGSGLSTHHADSLLMAKLPADGTYYLYLHDAQHQGGVEHAYRLRLSAPRPDFELRVAPSSLSLRGGASVPLTVYALRKDGFSGEIALALKDGPAGFTLGGARIPAGQEQVRITLAAPASGKKELHHLELEGRATVGGQEIRRSAVPAEDMMQAFAYRHLVPAGELQVATLGAGRFRSAVKILDPTPVKIPLGGTARVRFSLVSGTVFGKVSLELSEPPDGIAIQSVTPVRDGTELVLECNAAQVKAGQMGNLIVNASAPRLLGGGSSKAAPNRRATPLGTLPAIPFEIVPPERRPRGRR